MSARDVLEKGYADFGSGDIDAATEPWPEDFVWEGANAEGFPGAGRREGKKEAIQALGEVVGAWDEFKLDIDEMVGDGDTIVALGHAEGRKDDNSIKQPVVHVWRFDGDTPKKLQVLTDTLQSALALGMVK